MQPSSNTPASGEHHAYCADLVREQDYDRYLLTLFVTRDDRMALNALFALNIELAKTGELVSDPMLAEIRLQWWQESLTELSEGKVRDHPVCLALADLVQNRKLDVLKLTEMVEARRISMAGSALKTTDDVVNYAASTAGLLHEMAARCLTCEPDPASLLAARQSGTAWALIGLVRAIGFQAHLNQHSLPDDMLRDAGIDAATIFKGEMTPEIWKVADQMLTEADTAMLRSREARAAIDAAVRPILAINCLSEWYSKRLRQRRLNPFERAGDEEKSMLGPTAFLGLLWANMTGRY